MNLRVGESNLSRDLVVVLLAVPVGFEVKVLIELIESTDFLNPLSLHDDAGAPFPEYISVLGTRRTVVSPVKYSGIR